MVYLLGRQHSSYKIWISKSKKIQQEKFIITNSEKESPIELWKRVDKQCQESIKKKLGSYEMIQNYFVNLENYILGEEILRKLNLGLHFFQEK